MEDSKNAHQRLLKVLEDDFDGCEWFIISANELMKTLNDLSEMYKDKQTSLEAIKTSTIGCNPEIAIFIFHKCVHHIMAQAVIISGMMFVMLKIRFPAGQ